MRLFAVTTLVGLATYAAVMAVLSVLLMLAWRGAASLAHGRASALVALRLGPTVGALAAAFGVVMPAFIVHEPALSAERHPITVYALALVAVAAGVAALGRITRSVRATRRLRHDLLATARPLDVGAGMPSFRVQSPAPMAFIIGLRRAQLFMSSALLDALDAAEVEVVVCHEASHATRRHNLVRLVMRGVPDLVALTPLGQEIERAWAGAAEAEADDDASAGSPTRRVQLADALVRLARLASASTPRPELMVAALMQQSGLDLRVRRLLQGRPAGSLATGLSVALATALAALVVAGATSLADVHGFVEPLVAR